MGPALHGMLHAPPHELLRQRSFVTPLPVAVVFHARARHAEHPSVPKDPGPLDDKGQGTVLPT